MVADEVVEVGNVSREEASLLRIREGTAVFYFSRTSYIQSGLPVEYVRSTYRGDHYKIVNRLMRQNRSLLTSAAVK
jgi:GntR family transcriptional regulator